MIFLKPSTEDVEAASQIIKLFSEATGLHPNSSKSSLIPIRCDDLNLSPLQHILACPLGAFPCKYLGMPLSDSRLRRVDFQAIIDKLISKFSRWKIGCISTVGRMILVRVVLSAIPIFQMLAITQPKWFDKLLDKIRRSFLWTGKCSVSGGKCLVRWNNVCRPMDYGAGHLKSSVSESSSAPAMAMAAMHPPRQTMARASATILRKNVISTLLAE